MNQPKVLSVDDDQRFLEVAADFLSSHPEIEVAGFGHSGFEALQMVERLSPDLVLMDLSMPEMNGLEAVRRIKAKPRSPRVLMLTMYEAEDFCALAQEAGADGFITKADFGESLWPLVLNNFPRLQAKLAHEIA
jgi:DNA-binding NarL/FixJ family response regulator